MQSAYPEKKYQTAFSDVPEMFFQAGMIFAILIMFQQ